MNLYFHSRVRGFSLVELLTVTAIIAIVSIFVLVSVTNHRTKKEVEGAAFIVAGKVREAQVAALTGKQYLSGTTPCGYRAVWSGSQITISYVSKDGSDSCTVVTTMNTQSLSGGVNFVNSGAVEFVLPHGKIASDQVITLSKSGQSQVVCINVDGLIEARDSASNC